MRLQECPAWPKNWECRGVSKPSSNDISVEGVFKGIRLVRDGLSLAADYKGEYCTATFLPTQDPESLRSLRDKLRSYVGRPMRDLENLEVAL